MNDMSQIQQHAPARTVRAPRGPQISCANWLIEAAYRMIQNNLDPEVAESLRANKAKVIYLEVSISNAAPRVGCNRERPLLAINPRQQWLSLMEKRRPIYEELAGIKISTDGKKPNEVAREIKERSAI